MDEEGYTRVASTSDLGPMASETTPWFLEGGLLLTAKGWADVLHRGRGTM